jgi:hypothetical protein
MVEAASWVALGLGKGREYVVLGVLKAIVRRIILQFITINSCFVFNNFTYLFHKKFASIQQSLAHLTNGAFHVVPVSVFNNSIQIQAS